MANSSDNIETEISLLPNNEQRRSFALKYTLFVFILYLPIWLLWYFFVHSNLNYKIGIALVIANFCWIGIIRMMYHRM